MNRPLAAVAVAAMAAAGCLGNTYRIPRRDLASLATQPPEQRGEQVRVIQQFSTAERPPEATPVRANASVVVVASGSPAPRRRTQVVSTGGGGKIVKTNRAAASASEDSRFWIVLAAIGAVGLAATEGARFDGWARLHPMHPVHLFGPYGEYAAMPLAHIDPETAHWAERAVIARDEGPFEPLLRAPLNRVGFTYSLLMGTAEQPSADGTTGLGFMSHIQLGVFPTQSVGIQLDIGLGWREPEPGRTIFDGRHSLELDYLPLAAGRFHGGVFGQIGIGTRLEDGIAGGDRRGLLLGGGALVQLEITTRLALTARAQATRFYDTTVSDIGLGVSIY
jgi:hypothetical protein